MLNGLAGYIFGRRNGAGTTTEIDAAATAAGQLSAADETTNNNNEIEDDDWILINIDEKNENGNDDELDLALSSLPSSRGTSGSASPVTTVEALGWNLTPPPCFIASQQRGRTAKNRPDGSVDKLQTTAAAASAGRNVDDVQRKNMLINNNNNTRNTNNNNNNEEFMDVSIFENLLIEHPSMSVYGRRPKKQRLPLGGAEKQQSPPKSPLLQSQGHCVTTVRSEFVISQANKNHAANSVSIAGGGAEKVAITTVAIATNEPRSRDGSVDGVPRQPNEVAIDRRNNYVDLYHYLHGASFRSDVVQAATAAQQRVERAVKAKDFGVNRMRRQNLTAAYDASLGKGKQRKNRMKVFSGRSNDRKCQ